MKKLILVLMLLTCLVGTSLALAGEAAGSVYTIENDQYTITFDTAGGSAIDPITAEYGSEIKRPSAPQKTGYKFVCWLDENGNEALPPDVMPPYDMTFTAKWKAEHEHLLCGAADCSVSFHDPSHHAAGEFMPAPASSGNLTSGKYYLTKDISSSYWYGWGVPEGETVYLCLNGHKIEEMIKRDFNLMTVRGTLVLCDCTDSGMLTAGVSTIEAAVVVQGGHLIMYGGKITGMPASNGVDILENGSMTMYGGEISNNFSTAPGGGVMISKGHLTVKGGAISGNTVQTSYRYVGGAGVCVSNGTLTMQGGTISDNTALRTDSTSGLPGLPVGSGVYLTNGSTMTMSGGTISSNSNKHGFGGGLMVGLDSHATISGGTISGNEATYGTAIFAGADEDSWNIPEGAEGGSVSIVGGNISGGDDDDSTFGIQALYIDSISSAEVTGGTISSGRYAISKVGGLTLSGDPSLEGAAADIAVSSGSIVCGGRLSGNEGSITVAMTGTGLQYPHTLLRSCADHAVTEADVKVLRPVNANFGIRQNALGNAEIGRYTTITTQAVPAQAGVTSGDGKYFSFETAEISVAGNEGFVFTNWTDDKGNVMSQTPQMTYLADSSSGWKASLNLTANFTQNQYEIIAEADLPAGGSVSGAGTYLHGDPVTLTATAESGYAFAGWYENDVFVSGEAAYPFTATANHSFTAKFVHVHSWQYEVQSGSIGASCTANGCDQRDGGTVTISMPEGPLVYGDGRVKTVTVVGALTTGVASPTTDDVVYSHKADEDDAYAAVGMPENAGWYKASITVTTDTGEKRTAFVEYHIAKAEGPAAPTGLKAVIPSAGGSSDGRITGVNPAMEYASKADFANAQDCSGSTIIGLKAGMYYVRVRETENVKAGAVGKIVLHAAEKLTPPSALTEIGKEAFAGLTAEEIVLGGKVSSIGERAFAGCKELALITLPDDVQIAQGAFDGCVRLTLLCTQGSTGLAYAVENNIPYFVLTSVK